MAAAAPSPQFPEGYDPNQAAAARATTGDSRTWAGAVARLEQATALTDWSTAFTDTAAEPADRPADPGAPAPSDLAPAADLQRLLRTMQRRTIRRLKLRKER